MKNYAAIDLGTNSCRLLIAAGGDKPAPVLRDLKTTRLGEGMDQTGVLSADSMARTLECLLDFKKNMISWQVADYRIVATSAVREAANQLEFAEQIQQQTGLKVDIIAAREEARLSYKGVVKSLHLNAEPLVADLGGGSTEFMYCENDTCYWNSLRLGAVRATEANWAAVDILQLLQPVISEKARFKYSPLVIAGGTATTAVAMKLALSEYQSELVHGQILSRAELNDLYNMVEGMSPHLLRRLPGLQPERADIIGKGLLIILLIVDSLGKTEIIVSESDLLEGIIWELMEK